MNLYKNSLIAARVGTICLFVYPWVPNNALPSDGKSSYSTILSDIFAQSSVMVKIIELTETSNVYISL